jgi:poly-gamma-glutamate synthesis protein (capsule biosynthesis protein)
MYGCGDLINDYEGIGPQPWLDHGLPSNQVCMYLATLDAATGRLRGLDLVPMRLHRYGTERMKVLE